MKKAVIMTEFKENGTPIRMWIQDHAKKRMVTEIESKEHQIEVLDRLNRILDHMKGE